MTFSQKDLASTVDTANGALQLEELEEISMHCAGKVDLLGASRRVFAIVFSAL